MSVQIRRRREAASFLASFVGAQGELLVDTTNNRVQVHDGTTAGGWPAAKLSEATSAVAITGGTINGTPIGGTTPAACAATTLSTSGMATFGGAATFNSTVALGANAITGSNFGITGGAINGTPIGGATPSTVAATTLSTTGAVAFGGAASSTVYTATQTGGQFLAPGYMLYSDASQFYVLLTGTSTPTATFNGLRPLSINRTSGLVGMGNGLSVTGGQTVDTLTATTSLKLPSYTVATLPTAGTAGRAVFCSNGRMLTSTAGALESSGTGTGGLVTDNGTAWKIAGTNITVSA